MLKYTALIFLVAVAISWSCADANPIPKAPLGKRAAPYHKRLTENQLREQKILMEILANELALTADTSSEERILTERFDEALNKKWDSLHEFGKHVHKIYEEVTGKYLGLDSISEED